MTPLWVAKAGKYLALYLRNLLLKENEMVNATAIVESADITVAYINPPKEGKVWGNIKDTANNIYYGPPEKLAMFKPGETCKMEYTLSKDGKFKNIGHKVGIPAVLQKPVQPCPSGAHQSYR